jgi:hypothetical protein
MRNTNPVDPDLERLVDRHIELSELFDGRVPPRPAAPPRLVTVATGGGAAACLAALVDRALVAYEGRGFAEDATILALKFALAEAIVDESE